MGAVRKNSSRLCRGRFKRSKSAAESTTATRLPWRVTPCGPAVAARLTSSLKRAFASWICQLFTLDPILIRLVRILEEPPRPAKAPDKRRTDIAAFEEALEHVFLDAPRKAPLAFGARRSDKIFLSVR
jgi:hypothetical protein